MLSNLPRFFNYCCCHDPFASVVSQVLTLAMLSWLSCTSTILHLAAPEPTKLFMN